MSEIKANPVQENEEEKTQNTQQQQQQQQQPQQAQQQNQAAKKPERKFLSPEFISCPNNNDHQQLLKTYPHLQSLDQAKEVDYEQIKEAKSYVIRSNNDDDIHKAIKYAVWCSTPNNNEKLNKAFLEAKEKNQDIYLFYSVVKSGQFVGVAKLVSELKEETFNYWWQHTKWRGHFKVEWLFIKDIQYPKFNGLKNKEQMDVNRSKDGTEIDWLETGQKMIKIYQSEKDTPNIIQDFDHMDQREQFQRYIRKLNHQGNNGGQEQQHQMQQFQQQMMLMNMNQFQPFQQMPQQQYYQQQFMPQQQQYNNYPKKQFQNNNSYNNNNHHNNNNGTHPKQYQNKGNNNSYQKKQYNNHHHNKQYNNNNNNNQNNNNHNNNRGYKGGQQNKRHHHNHPVNTGTGYKEQQLPSLQETFQQKE